MEQENGQVKKKQEKMGGKEVLLQIARALCRSPFFSATNTIDSAELCYQEEPRGSSSTTWMLSDLLSSSKSLSSTMRINSTGGNFYLGAREN